MYIQNVTKTSADMTVDVKLSPGLRGEVDAVKLNRLLVVLNQVSATFAQVQEPSSGNFTARSIGHSVATSTENLEALDTQRGLFSIPEAESVEDITASMQTLDSIVSPLSDTLISSEQDQTKDSINVTLQQSMSISEALIDPTIVTMEINISIPSVVLDLLYNPTEGHHLILSLNSLQTRVVTRKYDMKTSFDMNELSIQDSLRAESQQDLIRTPLLNNQNFIKVTHLAINNTLSPYYRKHATEIDVEITDLCMNTDANTVLHLKPFFEVLLTKRGPPVGVPPLSSSVPNAVGVDITGVKDSNAVELGSATTTMTTPKGMLIECSFSNFTLDMLRSAPVETKGLLLQRAYSWRVDGLMCRIELFDLMSAEVKLKSTEVTDIREVSRNHLFRKIFCPIYDTSIGNNMSTSSSSSSSSSNIQLVSPRITTRSSASIIDMLSDDSTNMHKDNTPHKKPLNLNQTSNSNFSDLFKDASSATSTEIMNAITVVYAQKSRTISLVTVDLVNMATLVDVDTVLDFTNVAVSNAFAYLSLLTVTPPPSTSPATGSDTFATPIASKQVDKQSDKRKSISPMPHTPYIPSMEDEVNAPTNQTTTTMNVSVKVVNPRLLILEDPSAKETQALMLQSEINIHYTRDFSVFASPSARLSFSPSPQTTTSSIKKVLNESLHLSVTKLGISLINNIHLWSPKRILQPFSVEFHLRRKCVDDQNMFMKMSADIESTNARISTKDLVRVQSILVHRGVEDESTAVIQDASRVASFDGSKKSFDDSKSNKDLTWTNSINRRSSMNSAFLSRQYKFNRMITPNRHEGKQPPKLSFLLNVGPIDLVLIDDTRQQNNIPILRARCVDMTMYIERVEEEDNGRLRGEGSSNLNVEFFHPKLSIWEPFIENWTPCFRLCFETVNGNEQENSYELTSPRPLQVTVSGIMLCKLIEIVTSMTQPSVSVWQPINIDSDSNDVTLTNSLSVPITVYPSLRCSTRILVLDEINRTAVIPKLNKEGRPVYSDDSDANLPVALNIHLGGELAEEKQPLRHLPLNASKPRMYHVLQNADSGGFDGSSTVRSDKTIPLGQARATSRDSLDSEGVRNDTWHDSDATVFELVEEEIYEQQRYEPISGVWKPPFLLGDPYLWTDATCVHSSNMDTESVKQPPQGWHWLDSWHVDMEHEAGETDSDGWEYAPSFHHFAPGSIRRTLQSTDYCRRRRWTRTRAPVSFDEIARPLTVIWDVKSLSSGGKEVCTTYIHYIHTYIHAVL